MRCGKLVASKGQGEGSLWLPLRGGSAGFEPLAMHPARIPHVSTLRAVLEDARRRKDAHKSLGSTRLRSAKPPPMLVRDELTALGVDAEGGGSAETPPHEKAGGKQHAPGVEQAEVAAEEAEAAAAVLAQGEGATLRSLGSWMPTPLFIALG